MSIATDLQVPAQVEVVDGVYRGKWGYYSCDYATFLEIKELHRYTLHDLRATRRADRWYAKHENNRKGDEPRHFGAYIPRSNDYGDRYGYTYAEYYDHVLFNYRQVRHPVPRESSVWKINLPPRWRWTLEKLREFYGPLKK